MDWFRLYNGIINDPKVLMLRPETRWHYVVCLCVASRDGSLPCLEDMAVHLRVRPSKAAQVVGSLVAAGLIDEDPETGRRSIHGWGDWAKGMGSKPR